MSPYHNFHYLERRLAIHLLTNDHNDENDLRKKFVYRYLQGDGTFMLHLIASNVNDYVCRRIISELYQVFHQSLEKQTIGREALFKPILHETTQDDIDKQDNDNNNHEDDNESTDQTIAADIPPIPNPRHGRIFVERNSFPKLPSDLTDNEQNESQQMETSFRPTHDTSAQIRLRSSLIPLLKDIRRTSEIQTDSSDNTTPRYKNVEFDVELETTLPSPSLPPLPPPPPPPPPPHLPSPPPSSLLKGPSPYATTYLTTKKRNEHELPYIDDSTSSGSISGRLTNTTVIQQTEKPKTTTLASTSIFFRRSHDV